MVLTPKISLRADAQRNRERMLGSAERVFLARGAGASLEDVAKDAEVGIGTLYRHFPTRDDLFAAVFSEKFLTFAESWRQREGQLSPNAALRGYLVELVTNANIYRDLAASLGTVLHSETPGCRANAEVGNQLLQDAKDAGTFREDVGFDDLVVVVTAVCLAVGQTEDARVRTERLVDLFVGGMAKAAP
jgi:AcrR family transcriptional regulator